MSDPKKYSAAEAVNEPRKAIVLAELKAAIARAVAARAVAAGEVARADEVCAELSAAGVALKAGYLTPQQAIDQAEAISPGILNNFPPLSGLGLPRNEGGGKAAESESHEAARNR
jgi:hypothetical protein